MRLRPQRLAWREIDGGMIMLDLHTSPCFNANDSASMPLELLVDGLVSSEGLVAERVQHFDLEAATATAAVEDFLADLEAKGLLEI